MKNISAIFITVISFFISTGTIFSQASACPQVTVAPVPTSCPGDCVSLTATVQGSVATTSYTVSGIPYSPYSYTTGTPVLINIDDTWSGIINMPFCFQFFGNTYNRIVIGSNAIVTFDLSQASQPCQWPINNPIPSNQNPMNAIMAPFHDVDPSVSTPTLATDINWKVVGTAPCREFIVSWNDIAMFQCNSIIATSQMVLHETTNIIDIYIKDKPVCTAWNGAAAIEGIQNATGTLAYVAPGRNFPTQWTASNDGKRFMPSGAPQYSLSWTGPSGNLGNANPILVCPTTASTYTCTVINTTCAGPVVVTATTTVNTFPQIIISTSTTNATCSFPDGSAHATATGGTGTLTYQWIGGPAGPTYANIPAGTYSVIVTDVNGCSDTAIATVSSINNVIPSVAITNVQCFNSNDGSIVTNTSGGAQPYTYSWSPAVSTTNSASSLAPGNYTVTVTDVNGCYGTTTATVTQPATLVVSSAANSSTVCQGSGTQLSATSIGGTPAYTYNWQPGSLTGSTPNVTPASTTTYSVYVTDANGCSDSSTIVITVDAIPVADFSGDVLSGCAPLCVNFTNLSTISAGVITSGTWDFGDGSPIAQLQNSSHCYTTAGIYPVTLNVSSSGGCSSSVTFPSYITVLQSPVAAFSASPQPTTISNAEITFTDHSSNAITWNWTFGDLTNANSMLQNPTFTYTEENCYQVDLSVTSNNGCTNTSTREICIYPDITIYVPNAFTPDGDGLNDVFMPVHMGINPAEFEFWIFDRWGNLVYHTTTPGKGWNGTMKGEPAQVDTYVWKLTATDVLGSLHTEHGIVNLIR
ncbi:hypothetical protein BH11BAC7_BH11BAC7_19510 [soil metagenome]